ncbi:Uma2 family endonuclease [Solirubrobacter sp. CPCC 204708]|uniref:Uma2 family endonuclease n=1 Tax=Solirubrobacter deserti TaxID=2282478 RepID=A0ABT4RHW4_9ACTN|nr:Uma2 family endonuclease [Solirubrobacter deserti]MBE2316591.1 Uma2 family endonuclease [Solirubrobacter deserti]MDA0138123.1 Uma2 family endonuclease [Solirubrobacter deserti]
MASVTHPSSSAAEFAAVMERSGWRAPMELIAGEVVYIAPSGGSVSVAQTAVALGLGRWQGNRPGRLLSDVFVQIGDGFLAPDVAWWDAGREPEIVTGALETVPDVVIEVLSPKTRDNDLGPKREQYVAAGVRELWLIDPAERQVLVVTPDGERRLTADDTLTSPSFPGFAMRVAALFA